ncbi:hypothetical protein [Lacticaseibacillus absianus]|uniref:hypothetical protein n=1 Tax=Lacticaseibacillus absianus TaxID=2729623 RepID=UPI0015CBE033|nr:hypothetical protein [Lacticaseibacillus absianus]
MVRLTAVFNPSFYRARRFLLAATLLVTVCLNSDWTFTSGAGLMWGSVLLVIAAVIGLVSTLFAFGASPRSPAEPTRRLDPKAGRPTIVARLAALALGVLVLILAQSVSPWISAAVIDLQLCIAGCFGRD